MSDATPEASRTRRVLRKAAKLTLFLVIVGLAVQTGIAFFDQSSPSVRVEETPTPESDLGAWTFAGEGLSVAMRTIEVADIEKELLGSGDAGVVVPTIPKGDAESRILELLTTQPPTVKSADGRRGWRQTVSGIEVYAETCKSGGVDRLAIARAAWSATGSGLTLLEIRPEAPSSGNGKTAKRVFPVPKGATEMAQRVTPKGVVTGSLLTTRDSLDVAGKAMTASLTGDGWTVEPVEMGEEVSAKTMACRRGGERWQVVIFRDGHAAGQTMIMCVRE
jgi:hypothetical protein